MSDASHTSVHIKADPEHLLLKETFFCSTLFLQQETGSRRGSALGFLSLGVLNKESYTTYSRSKQE